MPPRPLVSVSDLDPFEITKTDSRVETTRTERSAPGGDRSTPAAIEAAWAATHREIVTQIWLVSEGATRACDAGLDVHELMKLRRTFGGWPVLAEGLHQILEHAVHFDPESPCVKYVDAVHFWLSRFTTGLGDLFAREELDGEALGAGILEACEFAALYALSHLARLYDACERAADDPLATACQRLHDHVGWLTWQIKDLVDG